MRGVLDRDDPLRAPLARAQLVEHAVLRHLEEPGRELAAQRESRQRLKDPYEDFLRQVLRERAVAGQAVDILEDRYPVGARDQPECPLVTPRRPAQDGQARALAR